MGTDVSFKMHGRERNLKHNPVQLRYHQQAQYQLLCWSASFSWVCCGVLRNCSGVAQSADVVFMCCCCWWCFLSL